jgi:hypothetical protein
LLEAFPVNGKEHWRPNLLPLVGGKLSFEVVNAVCEFLGGPKALRFGMAVGPENHQDVFLRIALEPSLHSDDAFISFKQPYHRGLSAPM